MWTFSNFKFLSQRGERIKLKQEDVSCDGAAIECRINAEDPDNKFIPSPGNVEFCYFPGGKDVRVETHLYSGYTIPPYYDSLIAKIITKGDTRAEALQKMDTSLSQTLIDPIKTTVSFCRRVIHHPDFQRGFYHTGFLDQFFRKEEE